MVKYEVRTAACQLEAWLLPPSGDFRLGLRPGPMASDFTGITALRARGVPLSQRGRTRCTRGARHPTASAPPGLGAPSTGGILLRPVHQCRDAQIRFSSGIGSRPIAIAGAERWDGNWSAYHSCIRIASRTRVKATSRTLTRPVGELAKARHLAGSLPFDFMARSLYFTIW